MIATATRRGVSAAKWLPSLTAAGLGVALATAWSPFYWPVASAIASVSIVCGAWAACAKRVVLPWQTVLIGVAGLWGLLQIAVGSSVLPWATFRYSLIWMAAAALFIAASQILRTTRDREIFLRVFLWIATGLSLCALFQMYGKPVRVFGLIAAPPTVVGTFSYKNQFAAMVELAAPIALWRMFSSRSERAAMAACFVTMFASVVASAGRAGMALVLAELLIVCGIAVARGRLSPARAAGVAGLFILALAAASAVAGVDAIWARLHEKHPWSVRGQLLESTLHMAAERPLLGFGLGTWRVVYPRFATFDIASFANEAHDDWAEWAAEGGVPFALLLLALVLSITPRAFVSVWGIGVPIVAIHALVDYPLREPCILFLWIALMAGIVGVSTTPWQPGELELQA